MQRPDETWHHLLHWKFNSVQAERLAMQVLQDQGFADFDPHRQLGGPDNGKDGLCQKDGKTWVVQVYFPSQPQKFRNILNKFQHDLEGARRNNANGMVFFANQELSLSERAGLRALAGELALEIFHVERIAAILDQPHMAQVRQQLLGISPPSPNSLYELVSNKAWSRRTQSEPAQLMQQQLREHSATLSLTRLTLTNFRGFTHLALDFSPNLTVLVAENGCGKSSILDACRIALWPFVRCFDLARADIAREIDIAIDDMHLRQMSETSAARQTASIRMLAKVGVADALSWQRTRTSEVENSVSTLEASGDWLESWGQMLQREVRDPELALLTLPVVAYYGTGRLWAQKKLELGSRHKNAAESENATNNATKIRTFAYRDCLESASNYQQFADWFEWVFLSMRETQIKNTEQNNDQASVWANVIAAVQKTIDSFLQEITGWHTLEFSMSHGNALILYDKHGLALKVSQLSDGIRNLLAMVGDLAYRCVKLNPHLEADAVQQTSGVVLIDELDLHLHPRWQQQIADQLCKAFPKIQFIVTTHSVQVLSTVPASDIRILHLHQDADKEESNASVELPIYQTRGTDSAALLARVMQIDSTPLIPEIVKLRRYQFLISQNAHQSEEGSALRSDLLAHFGQEHNLMQDCERMLRMQALKQKTAAQPKA